MPRGAQLECAADCRRLSGVETRMSDTPNSVTPDIFGGIVDQLVTLEGRPPSERQDVLQPLLAAARKAAGGRPVTMAAAAGFHAALQKGDTVFVLSGAGRQPTTPYGESDGPPGAAVVARALHRGLGAVPVFVCGARSGRPHRRLQPRGRAGGQELIRAGA